MFQKLFKGYIFCFLGHLGGGQLFKLFAHETNLKKKSSVHQRSNFYTISFLFSDSSRDEDEGIENDVEKNLIIRSELCKRVLQVCARHLAVEAEAQTHYKAPYIY